jgi:hypothetical protein
VGRRDHERALDSPTLHAVTSERVRMLEVLRDVVGCEPPPRSGVSLDYDSGLIGCPHHAASAVIHVRSPIVSSTDDPIPYGDLNGSV